MLNRFPLSSVARLVFGPVHADAFSKVCVFVVFENASIDSRLHYRFDAFSNIHTKTFENDSSTRFNVIWNLCACPSMPGYNPRGTYDVIVFTLMRFRPSTLIRYVSVRFRFDPPSRAFSNRCVFDENAQRISVDGKPKRIEVHAFSKRKRTILDTVLFISLYKRFFFFQLVLVANELTLDKLLTAKSKSSSSLSPASSPRGWVCVYFMLFLFLQKI